MTDDGRRPPRRANSGRALASDTALSRLDEAARAGWLYYIAGKTQDDIARMLNVSRPTAQRLVSLCRSERLITFRINHPVSTCMSLAASLAARHRLVHCDVVPARDDAAAASAGVAEAVAVYVERLLRSRRVVVVALGTGRAMRASVERVAPMSRPLHRLVSLVGNISPDGSASPFDALIKLAEITGARHFPMPMPLHASTAAERDLLLAIDSVQRTFAMANDADVWLTGLGSVQRDAALVRDGFVGRDELRAAVRAGGVGEITGWVFDRAGRILDGGINARLTSVPPQVGHPRPRICVAHGRDKVMPLRAALAGGLVNGLVTDESTARSLLAE